MTSDPSADPGPDVGPSHGEADLPRRRSCPFDPPDGYRALTADGPLHRLRFPLADPGWLVTRHAEARAVLTDSRFSHRNDLLASPLPPPFPLPHGTTGPPPEPGAFNKLDPPEHTRYRRAVGPWFSASAVERSEPAMRDAAAHQADALEAARQEAAADGHDHVDLVRHYARPLPARIVFDLLGVPDDVREPLQDNLDVLMQLEMEPDELVAAVEVVGRLLDELVAQVRARPGPDMLGVLAERGELDDVELRNLAWALLGGGTDTTSNMIGLGTAALLAHPEQLEHLRRRPELMPTAVEELLRHLTISQFGASRAATEDVELAGHRIAAGETVVVALPAANRDPAAFDAPDVLDVTRSARGHLAFGHGVHKCIGQYLARTTLQVAFTTLLERFPGLHATVDTGALSMRHDRDHYGVHELPVAW